MEKHVLLFGLKGMQLLSFILGCIGFAICLLLHVATFFGTAPSHKLPVLWMLHWLVFAVFVMLLALLWRTSRNNNSTARHKGIKRILPLWMYGLIGIVILNVAINLGLIFILNEGGVTGEMNGKYALVNHGEIIRELTEEEFYKHKAHEERLLSGSFLALYAWRIIVLLSHQTNSDKQRTLGDS